MGEGQLALPTRRKKGCREAGMVQGRDFLCLKTFTCSVISVSCSMLVVDTVMRKGSQRDEDGTCFWKEPLLVSNPLFIQVSGNGC